MPNFNYIDGRGATKGLWHFDNNATDSSLYGFTLNRGGTSFSSAQKKFGTHSILLETAGIAYLDDYPLDSFNQWTIDFWIYMSDPGASTVSTIFDSRTADGTQGILIWYLRNDAELRFYCMTSTGTYKSTLNIGYENNWRHIAMVKTSSTEIKNFYGGVLQSTLTIAGSIGAPNTTGFGFLDDYTDVVSINQSYPSTFDELRISSTARWTANYTPPTAAYVY